MAAIKITKKHHKHLNNPFPSAPKSLPLVEGKLSFDSPKVPSDQVFPIGKDFQLTWSTSEGGSLSVAHKSNTSRVIWSTVPGKAFISAACAETEVEESRGSFVIQDRRVHLVCNHQTIEDIRVTDQFNKKMDIEDCVSLSGYEGADKNNGVRDTMFPVLIITGLIFSLKKKKNANRHFENDNSNERLQSTAKELSTSAKYCIIFDQKTSGQVRFQVKTGTPNLFLNPKANAFSPRGRHWGLSKKLRWIHKGKVMQCLYLTRPGKIVASASIEEEQKMMNLESIKFNRVCFTYSSQENEKFYGFGEQFSHVNFKGKQIPIFVQEQGIGRGDQPITLAANMVSYRAGGDWSTTYAPSPFYMTSRMRSLYLEGYNYSVFDLTRHDRVQIQMHGDFLQGRILNGNSPSELIECFTETTGRPPELPQWITSGAVVGMQGGTDIVRRVWDELKSYDVPISAFWLQDWVGQRKTLIGSQLWWNWEVDKTRYWGWKQLIKDLNAQHVKVMTYCNPCLAPADDKPDKRRNLYEEAKQLDILVKDKHGNPYMVPNTAFDVGMLDLTHPHTATWFSKILQEMVDDGVRGWMADFGEGLPVDAVLYSGEDPIAAHNRYPELWAQTNREFVDNWKANCTGKEKEDPEEALVFFVRSGFRSSSMWAMLFWEGDQMVSWQSNDGIKSAVVGLLSSGISGYAFNHSDIGGYCGVSLPFIKYQRSEELLLRWMELSAFTIVFRTHEGNRPSSNSQFYTNDQTMSQFARFAKVYKAWNFYRKQLIKEASQKGLPICRHLFIHYPDDDHVHALTYEQFLVGSEILVVPVLDKGKKNVKAYFPIGDTCAWKHVWTGNVYRKQGCEAWVESPIGYPAVFVKSGSAVGETFLENLRELKIL